MSLKALKLVKNRFSSNSDEDDYMDIVSANKEANQVAWYKGIEELSVIKNTLIDFSVYPSPTTGLLNVNSETTIIQIEIYNLLGQLVESNTNQNTIDISNVSQGVYFIKAKDEYGNIGTKKVVKN